MVPGGDASVHQDQFPRGSRLFQSVEVPTPCVSGWLRRETLELSCSLVDGVQRVNSALLCGDRDDQVMAQTPSRYLDFTNTIWIPTQDQPPVFSAITDLQPNLPLGVGRLHGVGAGPDVKLNERPRPGRVLGPWRNELRLCGRCGANSAATTRREQTAQTEQSHRTGGRNDVEVQH